MTSVFYFWVFIFTKFLLVSVSITLDIHYPEDNLIYSEYAEDYPFITSIRRVNPYKFQCQCQPSCHSSHEYSSPAVFRHQPDPKPQPVYNPQPTYNPPTIPTQPPFLFSPSPLIFKPSVPTFQPSQFAPNIQSSNDQTKYNSVNYEQSHSQTQQNLGRYMRSQLYSETIQPSINFQDSKQQSIYRCDRSIPALIFPDQQINNVINPIKADHKREAGSIPLRGSDSRSTLESSKTQNGNDVATQSSIIAPKHPLNFLININHNRKKRRAQMPPLAYGKGIHRYNSTTSNQNNTATINYNDKSPQTTLKPPYIIIVPSRKLVEDNTTVISNVSNARSNYARPDNIYPNNQHIYPFHSASEYGRINNANILAGTARSSGSNGGRVYYTTGYKTPPTYIGPQRRIENAQAVAAVPSVYPVQSPLATFAQQPISSYGVYVGDRYYRPYRHLSSLRFAGSQSLPPSPSSIDHKTYAIYTPRT